MSILDVINSVKLQDNAITNQNRDMQYDLDKRTERINKNTKTATMDWDTFNQTYQPEKEATPLKHAMKWSIPFAIMGAVVGAIMVGSGGLGAIVVGALMTGAIAGAVGAVLSIVDDQKPEIRKKQLQKYGEYLDGVERAHQPARSQDMQVNAAEETTKWREHAELSKQSEQQVGRA